MHLDTTRPDRPAVLGLLQRVLLSDPHYLPGVAAGNVSANVWYTRKQPERVAAHYSPDGRLIGHAALVLNGAVPDGRRLERPRSWELSMLFVDPDHRRQNVATQLVAELIGRTRPAILWAAARTDGAQDTFMESVGWYRSTLTFEWVKGLETPMPGTVFTASPWPVGLMD